MEVDYNTEFDYPEDMVDFGERVFIVDFSLKPNVMARFLQMTKDITWIDHHATALEYDYGFVLPGVRNVEWSACKLTWYYLFPLEVIPLAVGYIDDMDMWKWDMADTDPFTAALAIRDTSPESPVWDELIGDNPVLRQVIISEMVRNGHILILQRVKKCDEFHKRHGYKSWFTVKKWLGIDKGIVREEVMMFVSSENGFGSKGIINQRAEHPIVALVSWLGDGWKVGLYTDRENIDVGQIAKQYGGGGHKGAAGFYCRELPFKKID
jgi:oligoribonuclease NrnB/cAMP/cGMP phosphodiesterase (DHH superfamily)